MVKRRSKAVLLITFLAMIVFDGCTKYPPEKNQESFTILCLGDSITAASYPAYLQTLIDSRMKNGKAKVLNLGKRGNTSGEYLKYLSKSKILNGSKPNIVLLQLGTNDVRVDSDHTGTGDFIKNMNAIIDLIASEKGANGRVPVIFIATIPPVVEEVPGYFDRSSMKRVTEEIGPAIKEIAEKRGLKLADNYSLFSAHPEWLPGIHPNEEGYWGLASSWLEAIKSFLPSG